MVRLPAAIQRKIQGQHKHADRVEDGGATSQQQNGSKYQQWYKEVVASGIDKDQTVGFFDPDVKKDRRSVYKKWAGMTFFLSIMIFSLLCLYWGALQHTLQNLTAITVFVVDFDGQVAPFVGNGITPLLGPMVTEMLSEKNISPGPHLGYAIRPASEFPNNKAVWESVYNERAWAAIIVSANATTLLTQALTNGVTDYDPTGAMQIVVNTDRDDAAYYDYILPELSAVQQMIISKFGEMWTTQNLPTLSAPAALAAAERAPQALNPAVSFSQYDMRAFWNPVSTPTTTVGLIYLIILSFFSFAFFMPIHSTLVNREDGKPVNFVHWMGWRLVATITAYFILSFFYSLVSLCFRVDFFSPHLDGQTTSQAATRYGHASFVVFWMLNWVGTMALGLASENMGMILGAPWFSLWLIFWVISNVATSFYPIPLAPRFFTYGYAWPLYNVVTATRTIIFDTHSRIGLNFGILFAWTAVSILFFPFACLIVRTKTIREKKKEAQKKKHKDDDEEGDKDSEGRGDE